MKLWCAILLVVMLLILPVTGACTSPQERQQYEAFAKDFEIKAIEAEASSGKYWDLWGDAMQKAGYYKEQATTYYAQFERYLDLAAEYTIKINDARSQGRYEYAEELRQKALTYCDLGEISHNKAEECREEWDSYLSLAKEYKAEFDYYAELTQEYTQQANHYRVLAEQ